MDCLCLLNATEALIEEHIKNKEKEKERGLKFRDEEGEGEFIKAIYKHFSPDYKTCKLEEGCDKTLNRPKFVCLNSIARSLSTMIDALGIYKPMEFVDLVMLNVMSLISPYNKGGSIYPHLVWNAIAARIGEYLDVGQPLINPLSIFGKDSAHSFICSLGRPALSGLDMVLHMYGKAALSGAVPFFDEELDDCFMAFNENTNENGTEFMKRTFKEVENKPVPKTSKREYLYSSIYPIIFEYICGGTSSDGDLALASEIFKLNKGFGVTIEMIEDFSRFAWSQYLYAQYAIACLTNAPNTREFADQVILFHKRDEDVYNSIDVFINLQEIRDFINKD